MFMNELPRRHACRRHSNQRDIKKLIYVAPMGGVLTLARRRREINVCPFAQISVVQVLYF